MTVSVAKIKHVSDNICALLEYYTA